MLPHTSALMSRNSCWPPAGLGAPARPAQTCAALRMDAPARVCAAWVFQHGRLAWVSQHRQSSMPWAADLRCVPVCQAARRCKGTGPLATPRRAASTRLPHPTRARYQSLCHSHRPSRVDARAASQADSRVMSWADSQADSRVMSWAGSQAAKHPMVPCSGARSCRLYRLVPTHAPRAPTAQCSST